MSWLNLIPVVVVLATLRVQAVTVAPIAIGCLAGQVNPTNPVSSTVHNGAMSNEVCQLSITQSTETFQGCASQNTFANSWLSSYTYSGEYGSPEECLQNCGPEPNAFIDPSYSGNYGCWCSYDPITTPPSDPCDNLSLMLYTHAAGSYVPGTEPSILVRRKLRERLDAQRNAKKAFCPSGLTACNVLNGGKDSFECIDTSSELESCGGCAQGVFGSSSVQTGIDCSSLPGVALGGVTCAAGHCVVSACHTGLVLGQDGTCA